MIRKDAKLVEHIFDGSTLEQAATRDGFGEGVVEAGENDARVVVLCADLAESTRVERFKEKFPERYIEVGVAEQNLATIAAGLAVYGKIPFITSYAAFSPGRNNEQIRTTISLNNVPVKICGMHAGVSVGPDGATHQQLEDIALMRVQPHMTVIVPADAEEARKATLAIAQSGAPAYLRLTREKTPVFTSGETPFQIGKAEILYEGESPEVALIGCGPLLYQALLVAEELKQSGISVVVINSHSVKPLDEETILATAKRVRGIVTIEEHQVSGGMGSRIAEFLSERHPVPIRFIGVRDAFGQSGTPEELIEHYGMGISAIKEAAKSLLD